jgi:hypothetical protein
VASVDALSRVLLGLAAIFALMAAAGLFTRSFAFDLVLGLAALFGASAALGIFGTKNSRARALLFALAIIVAVIATYAYVASRVDGPPGSKPTLTPWMPIAIALLAMTGAGLLVQRVTRNPTVGVSMALAVMAAMLVVFAQIATVAYVPAALLAIIAFIGLAIAVFDIARGGKSRIS